MKKPAHQSQPLRGPDPLVAAAEAMPAMARRKSRNRNTRFGHPKGSGFAYYRALKWQRDQKKRHRHHSSSSS